MQAHRRTPDTDGPASRPRSPDPHASSLTTERGRSAAPSGFRARRPLLFVPCMLAMLLAVGPILGLPALFDTFGAKGLFSDRCPAPTGSPNATTTPAPASTGPACDSQHDAMEDVVYFALALANASVVVTGILVDLIGGKWAAVGMSALWCVGTAACGFSAHSGLPFTAGLTLSAIAGSGWFVTMLLHHTRYVFPRPEDYSVMNGLLTTLFDAASVLPVAFRFYFEWPVFSLAEAYVAYAVVVGVPLFAFNVWFPARLPPLAEDDHLLFTATTPGGPHARALLHGQDASSSMATVPAASSAATAMSSEMPSAGNSARGGATAVNGPWHHDVDDRDDDGLGDNGNGEHAGPTLKERLLQKLRLGGGAHSDNAFDGHAGDDVGHGGDAAAMAHADSEDMLFTSVDRTGAYGSLAVVRPAGGTKEWSARHDGRTPQNKMLRRSPTSGASDGSRDDRRDAQPAAADRAEVLMLLKAGSAGVGGAAHWRVRAVARVKLAASAARKIVRQPLYWCFCVHSIAMVATFTFVLSCAGSIVRIAGGDSGEISEARNGVAIGVAVTSPLSLFVGALLRRLGARVGTAAVAAVDALLAIVGTVAIIVAVQSDGAIDATARKALLGTGFASALVLFTIGFTAMNIAVPLLFEEHALGVGLALGLALSAGGALSAAAGKPLTHEVHDGPPWAVGLCVGMVGGFTAISQIVLLVAVIRSRR